MLLLSATSTQPVECVSGCGSDSIALVAVFLAALAVCISVVQLCMQRREHKAFLERVGAHSLLGVEAHLLGDDRDVQEVDATTFSRILAVDTRNYGTKPADRILIKVFAPKTVKLHWSDAQGTPFDGSGPSPTSEMLDADGQVEAHCLMRHAGPIGLSDGRQTVHVRLTATLGYTVSLDASDAPPNRLVLPIRVTVASDDQPASEPTIAVERRYTFTRAAIQV